MGGGPEDIGYLPWRAGEGIARGIPEWFMGAASLPGRFLEGFVHRYSSRFDPNSPPIDEIPSDYWRTRARGGADAAQRSLEADARDVALRQAAERAARERLGPMPLGPVGRDAFGDAGMAALVDRMLAARSSNDPRDAAGYQGPPLMARGAASEMESPLGPPPIMDPRDAAGYAGPPTRMPPAGRYTGVHGYVGANTRGFFEGPAKVSSRTRGYPGTHSVDPSSLNPANYGIPTSRGDEWRGEANQREAVKQWFLRDLFRYMGQGRMPDTMLMDPRWQMIFGPGGVIESGLMPGGRR